MEKDILSLFVSGEVTASLIKKIFRLALVLMLCSIVYGALDIIEWYSFWEKTVGRSKNNQHYFYTYQVRPLVSIVAITLSIIGHVFNYNGYGFVSDAIQSCDPLLLNKGFRNFYTTYILALISFTIVILSIGYRLLM